MGSPKFILWAIFREEFRRPNQCLVAFGDYATGRFQHWYGRRENLRISGIGEEDGENLRRKMIDIGARMGVVIPEGAINVVHRSGQKGAKPRQILCIFVTRECKTDLLKKRKELKDMDEYRGVYLYEDLTPLRARLLRMVKANNAVKGASTRDGIIHCYMRDGSHIRVETPDDLFKIGCDDVDLKEPGLQAYNF